MAKNPTPTTEEINQWKDLTRNFSVLYPNAPGKCPTGLTRLQKLAAYGLALGRTQQQVATMLGAGASKKTLEVWIKKPNFVEFMDAVSYVNPLASLNEFLKQEVLGAAEVLAKTAKSDDPNIKQELKVDAAKTILRHVIGDPEQSQKISIVDILKVVNANARKQIHKDSDKSSDTGAETRSDKDLKIH